MLASAARMSARMVCTGVDMMLRTGASRETRPITTFSRRSTSVTMPRPSRVRTRTAERPSSFMSSAARLIGVSASQICGSPRITEVTVRLCTSGNGLRERAAYSSASRCVVASQRMPSSRLSSSTPTSAGMQ